MEKALEHMLILMVRYGSKFVERELIPEIEENSIKLGIFSQTAYEHFQKNKFAENSLYFHHSYANADIPLGQEYDVIARIEKGKILPDSIQKCHTKVLCFFSAFKTRPTDHAMRGHHELSLIQFENSIPQMIYELFEVTEYKPLSSWTQELCLCTEDTLQRLMYSGSGEKS